MPTVFSDADRQFVPFFLNGYTVYDVSDSNEFESLALRLKGGPRTGSPTGQPFQAQAVVGPPGWMAAGTWMTPTNDTLQLFGEQQQWVYQPFGGAAPQRTGQHDLPVTASAVGSVAGGVPDPTSGGTRWLSSHRPPTGLC